MSDAKPAEKTKGERKVRLAKVGLAFLTAGYGAILAAGGDNATFVTFASAVCVLCGASVWGNVKEHQAQPTDQNQTTANT